ncbi:DUF420 domain-containing protein [Methanolobus sp. ZRKC2]|uniref:DUF420 domain-containing protein n=1 Tax=Methanolobus sp. ZRKC2 TaxID=3125783 RepID=UPI0032532352
MTSIVDMGFLSLIIQFLLLLMVLFGVSLISKGQSGKHCKIISLAVILQLISVLIFMSAEMASFLEYNFGSTFLVVLLWLHHLAGISVFLLVIYIRLALSGRMMFLGNPYRWMKITLVIWILTFIGGVMIYLYVWQGIRLI